jgi:Major Facilitator Superfamily
MAGSEERPAGFRDVFAVAEYRALWFSGLLSKVGDQLARVALAVLAFDRTGSAAWTAVTYALTYIPALLGGPLLGGMADRYRRRRVMIGCDTARMVLVGLMAVPHVPFAVLCALLFAATLLDSPEKASRTATTPDVLTGEKYVVGIALVHMTLQSANLIGFAVGGLVVAAIGPSGSLLLDAGTFAASALLVAVGVRNRPASRRAGSGPAAPGAPSTSALGVLRAHRRLSTLLGLAMLAGFYVVPEALAVPYASAAHLGTKAAGLLMASIPAGNFVGVVLLNRFVGPAARLRFMGPAAVGTCLPLLVCAARPGLGVSLAAWSLSGALTSYQVVANATFVRLVPDEVRGKVLGLAGSALTAVQGVGMVVAGVAAEALGPARAIAAVGAAGVLVGVWGAAAWQRAQGDARDGVVPALGAASVAAHEPAPQQV